MRTKPHIYLRHGIWTLKFPGDLRRYPWSASFRVLIRDWETINVNRETRTEFYRTKERIAAKVAQDWWRIESARMEASKAMKAGQSGRS